MVSFLTEFHSPGYNPPQPEPVLLAPWPFPTYYVERPDPLAAMCHYRNSHSTERLPEPQVSTERPPEPTASTAKPADAALLCVRAMGDRSRIGV